MTVLRRRKLGRSLGPLTVLAALLFVSGALRFLGGPASAIAKEVGDLRSDLAGPAIFEQCEPPADVSAVLEALAEREARLSEREEYHARRTAALSQAEADIEAQLAALIKAEEDLEATLSVAVTAAEDDISRLTAVYENMKPKEAALLFETMAPTFAAGFLARMRPDVAAKVVEGLTPDVAYSISVILAGRNAEVPKD